MISSRSNSDASEYRAGRVERKSGEDGQSETLTESILTEANRHAPRSGKERRGKKRQQAKKPAMA